MEDAESEIDRTEGIGAINFLTLDDRLIEEEGEPVNPESIIQLLQDNDKLVFPIYENSPQDDFIKRINKSGEKWIVFTNELEQPVLVLDADSFVRSSLFCTECKYITAFCHKPYIINDKSINVSKVLKKLRGNLEIDSDNPIEKDIILLWNSEDKKIITGADIFGRLLKGI